MPEKEYNSEDLCQIVQLIVASCDGATAHLMAKNGIHYKKNYGVALPQLVKIASLVPQNDALAAALWQHDVREHKIVALMLCTAHFPEQMAAEWQQNLPTQEIAELMGMKLLPRMPYAVSLSVRMLASNNTLARLSAMHTLIRCIDRLHLNDVPNVAQQVLEHLQSEQLNDCCVAGMLLGRLAATYPDCSDTLDQMTVSAATKGGYATQLPLFFQSETTI